MTTAAEIPRLDDPKSRAKQPILPRQGRGIRRLLVCLDRSPLAEACLPYAVFLAKTFGSAVTLICVMQPPQNGAHSTDAFAWELARHEAGAYLERLQKEVALASGCPVDVMLEQGHPAERILAVGRALNADLTILGDHGHGGPTAWRLGSTVQQVLAVAHGSVFVVRSSTAAPTVVSPTRILVPLDGSVRTESVLPIAARIASAHNAELFLAHVVLEPMPTAVLGTPEDLELARELASRLEIGAKRYLERLREQLGHEQAVRTVVLRGVDERQSLVELTGRERIDLIVLSAHGLVCNPGRPFGSVTAHLLTHSNAPLLVLQDSPEYEVSGTVVDEALAPPLRASFTPAGD